MTLEEFSKALKEAQLNTEKANQEFWSRRQKLIEEDKYEPNPSQRSFRSPT